MDSEEEEEVHLLVELRGLPSADTIKSCQGTCAILGIDSEEPLLQLDNYVFKGHYEDILGTAMIFQHDKGRRLKYVCKTGKKLTMQRVFLKKKDEGVLVPAILAAQQVKGESKGDSTPSLDTPAELAPGSGSTQVPIPITTSGDGPGDQDPIPMLT